MVDRWRTFLVPSQIRFATSPLASRLLERVATRRAMNLHDPGASAAVRPLIVRPLKPRWLAILGIVLLPAALELWGCGRAGGSFPTAPSSSITVSDPTTATSLNYSADVAPILASECTYCHNGSNHNGGVDLSTYGGVLRTLTPGNANSLLIQVTRPGGLMYANFRSTLAEKSATIRRWIVDFNTAQ
jgi:hypothetical protein